MLSQPLMENNIVSNNKGRNRILKNNILLEEYHIKVKLRDMLIENHAYIII